MVVVNYLLVITWFPACIAIREIHLGGGAGAGGGRNRGDGTRTGRDGFFARLFGVPKRLGQRTKSFVSPLCRSFSPVFKAFNNLGSDTHFARYADWLYKRRFLLITVRLVFHKIPKLFARTRLTLFFLQSGVFVPGGLDDSGSRAVTPERGGAEGARRGFHQILDSTFCRLSARNFCLLHTSQVRRFTSNAPVTVPTDGR